MSTQRHAAAGVAAKAAGDALEAEIELICSGYLQQGVAKIHKVDPPIKIVRRGKSAIGIPQPSPWVDWLGCWTAQGGRTVHFESKNTGQPRLPLLTKDGLKESQWDNLVKWHRAGALTGVIWGHQGRMKFISLATIAHALEQGDRSLKWRHHQLIPRGAGLVTWDFLAAAAELA